MGKKKRTNPRHIKITPNDRLKEREDAIAYVWSILFNIMHDKFGYTSSDLPRLWQEISRVSQEIADHGDIGVTATHIKNYCGIEVRSYCPMSDKNSVAETRKQYRGIVWAMFLEAIIACEKFTPEQMRELWDKVQYLEDSCRKQLVKISDLQAVLDDEAKIRLV